MEKEKMTHREEFESVFGEIDDEKWDWLKHFVDRNHEVDRKRGVVGYRIMGDAIYHPSDVEIILEEN